MYGFADLSSALERSFLMGRDVNAVILRPFLERSFRD